MLEQNPKRAGGGATGSKATGGVNGVRVGNTPAVDADIDAPGGRHTSGHGQVEFTSENWPVRESGKTTGETFSGDGGRFPFQTASENESN